MDSVKKILENNINIILMIMACVLGYIFGAGTVRMLDAANLESYVGYIKVFMSPQSAQTFLSSFLDGPLYVIVVFLLGFSLIGFLFILPIIFYKAYTIGLTSALCYLAYGIYGSIYVISAVFPSAIIIFLLMCLSGNQSMSFSLSTLNGSDNQTTKSNLKNHILVGVLLCIFSFVTVLWSLYVNPFILGIIN